MVPAMPVYPHMPARPCALACNAHTRAPLTLLTFCPADFVLMLCFLPRARTCTRPRAGGDIGNLPPFKQGETYPLSEDSVPLTERMTSPPSHLSEAELISLMERHGIGTDASIATHINNICERNYVQIAAGIAGRLGGKEGGREERENGGLNAVVW